MNDDVLDALDRMIAGFGKPDFGRFGRSDAPNVQEILQDSCGFEQVGRFGRPKTGSIGENSFAKKDSLADGLAGARVESLSLDQKVQTVQSRRNPGQILDVPGQNTVQGVQSRRNPNFLPEESHFLPEKSRRIGEYRGILFTATPVFLAAKKEMRWHLEHGERVPRDLCAGCRMPIGDGAAMDLADDNRVHLDPDYRCLIAWGETWRAAARAAEAWRR